jgi:hypothetical protein
MTEPMLILCAPASHTACAVPGSLVRHCTFCDERVWLSPSTRAWQQRSLLTAVELCCPGCMKSRVSEITEICVPTEQAEEVRRVCGLDSILELERLFKLKVTQI